MESAVEQDVKQFIENFSKSREEFFASFKMFSVLVNFRKPFWKSPFLEKIADVLDSLDAAIKSNCVIDFSTRYSTITIWVVPTEKDLLDNSVFERHKQVLEVYKTLIRSMDWVVKQGILANFVSVTPNPEF